MKIAVTYNNGDIYQHFGRTETFKVYDAENGQIVSSRIIVSDGPGHGALAGLLSDYAIDVLICGGIGGGAQQALAAAGIEVCAGASGSADAAVEAYLKGELESAGVTCDHHHGEGHDCGHHEDGAGCSHDAGGCCGADAGKGAAAGEGAAAGIIGPNVGKTCRVHYRGTLDDGTQFDASYDRGEPIEFVCGAGMMIPGFDAAVAGMEVGQIVDVHLLPEEAYGPLDPNAVFKMDVSEMPGADRLEVGMQVYLSGPGSQPFPVTVVEKDGNIVTFDANHEFAGKALNFTIELVEVFENA